MKMTTTYKVLFLAISTALINPANANSTTSTNININKNNEPVVDLGLLKVKTKKTIIHKKKNEITGLGKVVKSKDDIDNEMVINIRDLTRYDPGISVVEQGRGASSGYAMRGVDKNRVAMNVDGLSQAQSYLTLKSAANGGAINEIEYENIKSIELSKGASSAEYGNGAIGGAVGFVTKDSADIIKEDQNWGFDTKTAYSSKNNQLTQSFAGAFKHGNFDHLGIVTVKNGKQTDIHPDAKNVTQYYKPLVGYFETHDNRNGNLSSEYYLIKDDCPALNCTPKALAEANNDNKAKQNSPNLTGEALAMSQKIAFPTHSSHATDYTGKDRIIPNPMDYKSLSFFYKGGFKLSPNHYLGGILEHTKQRYDSRDMTFASYYTKDDHEVKKGALRGSFGSEGVPIGNGGIATNDNPLSGLVYHSNLSEQGRTLYGMQYAKGLFIDERHQKNRYGLFYKYTNPKTHPSNTSLADTVNVSLDHQNIGLDTHLHQTRCSIDGVEKCRASIDKPWSYYHSERNFYQELLTLGQINWQKNLEFGAITHRLSALAGLGGFKSVLNRGDYFEEYASGTGYLKKSGNGRYGSPYIFEKANNQPAIVHNEFCNPNSSTNSDCSPRIITGNQRFLALKDLISLGSYADLGVGVRYDHHNFKSDDSWTPSRSYDNFSWNMGLTVKPTDWLEASYRYSTGFRTPAFYELYGVRTGTSGRQNPLTDAEMRARVAPNPEKSVNHEFGVGIKGDFGSLEGSIFKNNYKDMIAIAQLHGTTMPDYFNAQDVKLTGVNVLGKLDWHEISSRLPDGLYSTLAYNKVKVKDRQIKPQYRISVDPILDAVQPARVVAGLGYDSPSGKWGIGSLATYSAAKQDNELTASQHYGAISIDVANKKTRPWYTYDLTGYYHLHDNWTLRAGVYNLANRKYSTWESVRQSTINAVNQQTGSAIRYVAPGRSFMLAVEGKF